MMPEQHQLIDPDSWAHAIQQIVTWATDSYGLWAVGAVAVFALAWRWIGARKSGK